MPLRPGGRYSSRRAVFRKQRRGPAQQSVAVHMAQTRLAHARSRSGTVFNPAAPYELFGKYIS